MLPTVSREERNEQRGMRSSDRLWLTAYLHITSTFTERRHGICQGRVMHPGTLILIGVKRSGKKIYNKETKAVRETVPFRELKDIKGGICSSLKYCQIIKKICLAKRTINCTFLCISYPQWRGIHCCPVTREPVVVD